MPDEIHQFRLQVLPQPNITTCGPTCLHSVYRYFSDETPLDRVIAEVEPLPGGGTLAVSLACHALRRGYNATIYTYNLQLFDPTWFKKGVDLQERFSLQKRLNPELSDASEAYLEFFALRGLLRFEELSPGLLRKYLKAGIPILTGLSATYLYGCARERDDAYDDLRGAPAGHFVVLSGYNKTSRQVLVADPLQDNPGFGAQYYWVGIDRLIGAILLGIVTYDANLLIVTPK